MQIDWYGQSAFRFAADGTEVFVDPFGDMSMAAARGMRFDYPAIAGVSPDLLIVTHEHRDHNAVEVIGGEPALIRSAAGTHESPVGQVIAVASEHDDVAGTARGANTIVVFELDGLRIAHFGDFGQSALRPEQQAAIGEIDIALVPVGGRATIGGKAAAALGETVGARWVIPMHYGNSRVDFLEPVDEFVQHSGAVHHVGATGLDTAGLPTGGPLTVVFDAP
jgi:L-ascorbate metabolism protein UlaG (beta-lactamase superfamily)